MNTPLSMLEEEERRARMRLAAYRGNLYHRKTASPMAAEMRLRELERKWNGVAERLRKARKSGS